jgi:hypothetical protein
MLFVDMPYDTDVTVSEEIESFCRQSCHYSVYSFIEAAEQRKWSAVGFMTDVLGSPISSSADERYYGYNVFEWAIHASNAEQIEKALDEIDPEGWGYGPAESFIFDASNAAIVAEAERLQICLSDYPVLNDERCSELEWEAHHPSEYECHSSDPDCGCDVKSHSCSDVFVMGVECGEIAIGDDDWYCLYCQESYNIGADEREVMRSIVVRMELAALVADG